LRLKTTSFALKQQWKADYRATRAEEDGFGDWDGVSSVGQRNVLLPQIYRVGLTFFSLWVYLGWLRQ